MLVTIVGKNNFDGSLKKSGVTDDNIHERTDLFIISINDTRGTPEVPYFKYQHQNVLTIFFDDVERDIEDEKYGKIEAFSYGQARQILHFVQANAHRKKCLVHCAAGISRSGAVGTFINDYFGADYNEFKKRNKHILPNGHILAMLNRVARIEGDRQESLTGKPLELLYQCLSENSPNARTCDKQCPKCGTKHNLIPNHTGTRLRCFHCAHTWAI